MTTILGIETSCDETAAAVVVDGRFIRSNVVFTQEELHRRFGGVVPELASREHVLGIVPAIEKALAEARAGWSEIGAVGVSYGPGLAGSLVVGVNAAKAIALARGVPLVGLNHLEGHVYANWLVKRDRWLADDGRRIYPEPRAPQFPLLCLIVSGGHSELVFMEDHCQYRLLGRTRDDAAGEAFDKVARILDLGYPGGPAVQRTVERLRDARGNITVPAQFQLTRPWLRGTHEFSFSGLKTAVLRLAEGHSGARARAQIAAGFQESVVDVLVGKTIQAAEEVGARQIALAGGVAANKRLREIMLARTKLPVLIPEVDLCTDNAAMVAAAAHFRLEAGHTSPLDLDVKPNLRLA